MEIIQGIVEKKLFYNENNHYGVFLIALDNILDRPLTIVGNFYNIEIDSYYEFKGNYVDNPRFGMQFKVESFKKIIPTETESVIRYLSGPSFPGIGRTSAENIVDKYGGDVLEKIRKDPLIELKVKGIGKDKLDNLKRVILEKNDTDHIVDILANIGVSGKVIANILAIYGSDARELIEGNPYRMLDEVNGVGFKTADKIGKALHFQEDHPYRIEGVFLDRVKSLTFDPGHSFIDLDTVLDSFNDVEHDILMEAYESLIKTRRLIQDEDRLYHYTQYDAEINIVDFLMNFKSHSDEFVYHDFDKALIRSQEKLNIEFDDEQIEALKLLLKEDISILTGGPGTGKSTLLSGLVSIMQIESPMHHITLCAPTGRAAKRLQELTNVNATTIHSALKWNPDTNEFGVNEFNPLDTDILIVDEFSMVDTWLLSQLLKASTHVKKIVFVGDKDQLPSVGPGFVLGDMIESKFFSVIELERNYRQIAGSEVIDLALQMNEGFFDLNHYSNEVRFFDSRYGPTDVIVTKCVQEALNKGYSIYDVQVLAPIYATVTGVDYLNHVLQSAFNPKDPYKRERVFGSRIYREGDKILQLKNQPEEGVYNGDIGILIDIDESNNVIVDFDGIFVSYDSTNLIHITHAYCMTVHKAQGSEYPIVVLLANKHYYNMLSKRLYYTAVTRSSKSLILVGEYDAFVKAVENSHEDRRNTYLKARFMAK